MDLYSSSATDIQNGNMRSNRALSLNSAIAEHNNELGGTVALLKQQAGKISDDAKTAAKSQNIEQATQGAISGFMDARGIKDGVQAYKDWTAKGKSKAAALRSLNPSGTPSSTGSVSVGNTETSPSVSAPANTTTEPNITATPEGEAAQNHGSTGGSVDVNPSAEEHNVATVGEEGTGKSGSMIHNGLKSISGLSDDAIDKVGKGFGALGSSATAGMDIYNDVKKGKLGDNGWEDVGQVAQIGGAISDVIGTVFPPAEIIGGALGVVGGIFSDIGEAFEGSDKKKEAQQKEQQQQQAITKAKTAQDNININSVSAASASVAAAPRVSS